MSVQVPNFTNPMLNRVAQGDMSIFEEGHDFTFTEWKDYNNNNWNALMVASTMGHFNLVNRLLEIDEVRDSAAAYDNWALRLAAINGHLEVVNRLLEIDEVRANAEACDNWALRFAAERGHSEVVHALAKVQWPLGKQDMPEGMQQYLPMIRAGAQLYAAKIEQERILISALEKRRVVSTKRLYAPSPSRFDPRAHRLFTLRRVEVDSIANYVGYKRQYLADQIRKDDWQNKWNKMRRSERLYGLFTETNKIRREEQRALVVYKPQ